MPNVANVAPKKAPEKAKPATLETVAKEYAEMNHVSLTVAKKAVTSVLVATTSVLAKEGVVQFHKLFTLKIATRAARQGINPQTGAAMVFPEKKVIKLVASKSLLEDLNANG